MYSLENDTSKLVDLSSVFSLLVMVIFRNKQHKFQDGYQNDLSTR